MAINYKQQIDYACSRFAVYTVIHLTNGLLCAIMRVERKKHQNKTKENFL